MAETNRYWQLAAHPEGTDFASAIKLVEEPMPEPGDRQILVRNLWLSLDAGTRMWMTAREDSYMAPTPLGSKVIGFVLGRVVSSRHPDYAPGDLVRAYGQWADHSVLIPDLGDIWKLDTIADMRQHFAVLGPNGWTAYVGLNEYGRVRPGETVLVSAAAGATGLLAAQFAREMGCRVIGIAGGAEKCAMLTGRYGLAAAIDYKARTWRRGWPRSRPVASIAISIASAGRCSTRVLPNMAMNGRVAVCGLIATYDQTERSGPKTFDLVLMKRLTIAGFFSPIFTSAGRRSIG